MQPQDVVFRTYAVQDETAVWRLHEWAMRDTGVDPSVIPGTDDLRSIENSYFDPGGQFIVGIVERPAFNNVHADLTIESIDATAPEALTTHDGVVVAMGGYLPNSAGHVDERDRPGAAELHRMRVAPPCQRYGYGRQLLRELEERAEANGFKIMLATTSTTQSAALSFYCDHGYERVRESTAGAYDLVHFEKSL